MRGPAIVCLALCACAATAKLLAWTPGAWREEGTEWVAEAVLDPGGEWDELIVSFNTEPPAGQRLAVLASAEVAGRWTKPYTLAVWGAPGLEGRTSVNGQKDADGDVATDTLVLARPAARARIVLRASAPVEVRHVAACFTWRGAPLPEVEPNRAAWGKALPVPQLRQTDFPNGNVICSPTCLSMVLGFWATELGDGRIASEVPETCRWVYDPGWGGTGNWVFNTAYAGIRPGIRAYVSRLQSLVELEDWIAHGWPVVCSVSNAMLKGRPAPDGNDGHLVVLVGFDERGDPVFNDPGREVTRQTYRRADFAAAWARSQRTVYLVYPERARPPLPRFGNWQGGSPAAMPLPDAWHGTWAGDLEVLGRGAPPGQTEMTLEVGRSEGSSETGWSIRYAGQAPRRYILRPVLGKPGEFDLDEQNGIVLRASLHGSRLTCAFRVGEALLFATYELAGDEMRVTVASFAADGDSTGVEGTGQVTTFPMRSEQRAVLRRRA